MEAATTNLIQARRCVLCTFRGGVGIVSNIPRRLTWTSNTPSRSPSRPRTSITARAVRHRSSPIRLPRRIRMNHTWTGSTSPWARRRSRKRSARHMAMTSKPSRLTMRAAYVTCLVSLARGASVPSFRVAMVVSVMGLASQTTALIVFNSSRCSPRLVSDVLVDYK
jgi:hypothetical protein